jgi:FtsP/CotA-like multicopper oxidase with cupredoxin domain
MAFSKGSLKKIAMNKIQVCSQRRSVENIKVKLLLAIMLAVFLAVPVATTLIHSANAATTRSFTLYGGYLQGWGFTSSSITSPGPTIVVEQGDSVNLTLINNDGDGVVHRFFVSYSNSSSPSSGDPESPDFSGTINFQFVASSTVGTYTYYCFHHPNVMYGTFKVVLTGTIPEFQPLMLLLIALIASTAVVAFAYRRKR